MRGLIGAGVSDKLGRIIGREGGTLAGSARNRVRLDGARIATGVTLNFTELTIACPIKPKCTITLAVS